MCYDKNIFESNQIGDHFGSFNLFHSVEKRYAVERESSLLGYCRDKLKNDVILLTIEVDTLMVVKSNWQMAATTLDKIGLIGMT